MRIPTNFIPWSVVLFATMMVQRAESATVDFGKCTAQRCGSTLPVPPLLNLLVQSYLVVLFPLFLFTDVLAILSHLLFLLRVWIAGCQLRSFSKC